MTNHGGLVRLNILTILAGLGIQSAITTVMMVGDAITIANGVVFIILVANFYHAKVMTSGQCDDYAERGIPPIREFYLYWLNMGIWIIIGFMSFTLAKPYQFWAWNCLLALVDLLLVWYEKRVHQRAIRGLLLRANRIWMRFDAGFAILAVIIGGLCYLKVFSLLLANLLVCFLLMLATVGDYYINRRLYFRSR